MDCLSKLRKERGLRQKDVAEALRIDRTTYVKYENGKSHPDHEMLKRIADFYGVSIDYLLNYQAIDMIKHDSPFDAPITFSELQFLDLYRSLNDSGKEKLLDYARYLSNNPDLQQAPPILQTGA